MSIFGQQSTAAFGAPASSAAAPSAFGASQPSLFGGASTLAATPAFGKPTTTSAFGQPPATTSLFGQQPAPATGGSLFGAAPAPAASVFGGAPAAAPAPAAGGGFNFALTAAPVAGAGAFGGAAGGAFGQAQTQQQQQMQMQQMQQQQQQVPQPPPGSAKVSQLPPQAIQMLEAAERLITEERSKAARLFALQAPTDEEVGSLRERCAAVRRKLVRTDTEVESLASNAVALRNAVRGDRRAADGIAHSRAQLARRLELESGMSSGAAYAYGGAESMAPVPAAVTHVDPGYFAAVVDELEERANTYKREIDQIADFLRADGGGVGKGAAAALSGLDALHARYQSSATGGTAGSFDVDGYGSQMSNNGGNMHVNGSSSESRGRTIEDITRRQYEYFMVVANNVAAVHETLTQFKDDYVAEARRHDPDAVDPFSQADARERAEEERKSRAAAAVQVGNGTAPGAAATNPAQPAAVGVGNTTSGTFGGSAFGATAAAVSGASGPGLALAPLAAGAFGAPIAAATPAANALSGFTTAAASTENSAKRPASSSGGRRYTRTR